MANPNIVNVTSITGKTSLLGLTTNGQTLVANGSNSNTVHKINNILISNVNGSNPATVNVWINRTGANYYLAYLISVPAGSTFVALDKGNAIYLEEGDTLQASASVNSYLHASVSYEVIA